MSTQENRLLSLGFKLTDGHEALYTHQKFDIKIDLSIKNGKISYPDKLIIHDQTTSNLAKEESYVVLQCVIKLLELGYIPENIELERAWELGTKEKGKLDILIKHSNNKAYTMIECKTKKEFSNTWDKMLKDGKDRRQQLFSYYQQDKNASTLILYTFDFDNNLPEYHVIQTTKEMKKASNLDECINEWNKNSVKQGFFEKQAYQTDFDHDIRRENLQEITEETGNTIYHAFATILRKHSVSDKSNAYNRLFNLFLCKIIDEDRELDKIVEFQWKENDTYITLAKRLNDLYKNGMIKFLNKEITDYTDKDLQQYKDDKVLQKMFDELRLYKNNEFSFIDVFNEESFIQNMKVVKDIVQLLQHYQFRYTHKHQYLGNFFELLLNTGFKQENGQFFTPVPLAEFIVRSLPLKEMIQENDSLPYIIDYACGSGHFLTEGMDEIQFLIENNELSQTPSVKKDLKSWNENPYKWANEYVYGIDNDYRLIKTTKVACFLNGDGEANIIHTNGLNRFGHKDFTGKLQKANQFDILLANPPYSVDGFLHQLSDDDKKVFKFTKIATSNTNDIECFFIERSEQLLKDKGMMGIVLPISILQNSDNLYTEARKILLQGFEIKALFDVGSSGFMATGTNTVIVFAQKNDSLYNTLRLVVDKFMSDKKDVVCNGIKNAFSLYVSETYDEMSFEAYSQWIDTLKDKDLENEKDRMTTFMMSYNQVIPVIKSGEKDKSQSFLGYKFSNAKGNEGLHPVGEGKLYPKDTRELQNNKANYYIYQSFLGNITKETEIHKDLKDDIFITRLSHLLAWENKDNWSAVRLSQKKKIVSKYPIVNLGAFVDFRIGGTPARNNLKFYENATHLWVSIAEMNSNIITDTKEKINDLGIKNSNVKLIKKGTLLFSFKLTIGKVAIAGKDLYTNEAIAGLIFKDHQQKELKQEFVYFLFSSSILDLNIMIKSNTFGTSLNLDTMPKIQLPLPPIDEQNRIVSLMQAQDDIITNSQKEITELREKIQSIDLSGYPTKKLESVCLDIVNGGTPDTKIEEYWDGEIAWATLVDTKNKYLLSTERTISKLGMKKSSATMLPINTVIFSSRATIGDVSISKIPVTTNQGYKSFICNPKKIEYEYLYYVLKQEGSNIAELSTGTKYKEVSKTQIANYKIPVPSLEEQQKIVDEINTYESQIDSLNQKITQAKDTQKQIMSDVFTIEDVI
ncbi:MAG: restriction endonuclease subunit S [Brevinemataceae bacterium]